MEKLDLLLKTGATAIGGALGFLVGGWSKLFIVLLIFVVTDYISGMIAARIEDKLKSKVGFIGIARKVMIFVIVAVAHQVDLAIGNGNVIRDATIFFYLANELLSIIENTGRIGVPVPSVLKKGVEVLKEKDGERK
ncbi:phage holin family protein [Cytobacillus sp. IB215316]|uniref:phage holin family protein n=1 Tax=Cytobacillus sp. IB215316 TaxID=3097354 RepID=UPI002A17FC7C|nr:phage holin family protein [Cytobacillus sp. IB215316]MDX8359836.1 phage holin family protein [Cytobacillus sp. IB215316]